MNRSLAYSPRPENCSTQRGQPWAFVEPPNEVPQQLSAARNWAVINLTRTAACRAIRLKRGRATLPAEQSRGIEKLSERHIYVPHPYF